MTVEKTERIRALLELVRSRITLDRYDDVSEYLREEEWQLAVEMLAYSLDEREAKLSPREWHTFSDLAESVRLSPGKFSYLRAESK